MADLRLEHHHQRQKAQLYRLGEDIVEHVQVEDVGQPQHGDDQHDPPQHLSGPGLPGELKDLVKNIGDNGDVDQIGNLNGLKVVERLLNPVQECVHISHFHRKSTELALLNNHLIILQPAINGKNLKAAFYRKERTSLASRSISPSVLKAETLTRTVPVSRVPAWR